MPILFIFGAEPGVQKILNKHIVMAQGTNRLYWFHFTDENAKDQKK